jgi:hypothetical protein
MYNCGYNFSGQSDLVITRINADCLYNYTCCLCYTVTNTGATTVEVSYTDCEDIATLVRLDPSQSEDICVAKLNPEDYPSVIVTLNGGCVSNQCQKPTPTPTMTPTITPTITKTPTHTPTPTVTPTTIIECVCITVWNNNVDKIDFSYVDCTNHIVTVSDFSGDTTMTFCGAAGSVNFASTPGLVSEGLPCVSDGHGGYTCNTSTRIASCDMIFNSNNGIYLSKISN